MFNYTHIWISDMAKIGLNINDDLEDRFKRKVFERMGMKKGNITDALEDAIELWIDPDSTALIEKYRTKKTRGKGD